MLYGDAIAALKKMDVGFLIALGAGIAVSVTSTAPLPLQYLHQYSGTPRCFFSSWLHQILRGCTDSWVSTPALSTPGEQSGRGLIGLRRAATDATKAVLGASSRTTKGEQYNSACMQLGTGLFTCQQRPDDATVRCRKKLAASNPIQDSCRSTGPLEFASPSAPRTVERASCVITGGCLSEFAERGASPGEGGDHLVVHRSGPEFGYFDLFVDRIEIADERGEGLGVLLDGGGQFLAQIVSR